MRKMEMEDLTDGVDASITFELNGKTYSGGHFKKFVADVEANVKSIKVLGRKQELTKVTGVKNTFSYEALVASDLLAKQVIGYINGENDWPVLKVSTTQTNSKLGSSVKVYTGVQLSKYTLTNIDTDSDSLTRSGSGTYQGVTMPKSFSNDAVPEL